MTTPQRGPSKTPASFTAQEQVIIRYGSRQGQQATVIRTRQADVYEVRVEDGSILFYSGKGLAKGAIPGDAAKRTE
jgi:hypothetical protein